MNADLSKLQINRGSHSESGTAQIDWLRMILLACFDHLEESFLIKKFNSKSFACLWKPVVLLLKPLLNDTPGYTGNERVCVTSMHVTYFNSTLGGVEPSVLLEPPLPIDTLSCSWSFAASVSNRVSRSKSWSLGDGGGEAEWLLTSEIAASRILHSSNWLCGKKNVNIELRENCLEMKYTWFSAWLHFPRLAVFTKAEEFCVLDDLWRT